MRLLVLLALVGLIRCQPDGSAYTLYRDSVLAPMRLHVATFDANDGEDYNRDNCEIARDLFQSQPGVTVRYWCEKGRYQK